MSPKYCTFLPTCPQSFLTFYAIVIFLLISSHPGEVNFLWPSPWHSTSPAPMVWTGPKVDEETDRRRPSAPRRLHRRRRQSSTLGEQNTGREGRRAAPPVLIWSWLASATSRPGQTDRTDADEGTAAALSKRRLEEEGEGGSERNSVKRRRRLRPARRSHS